MAQERSLETVKKWRTTFHVDEATVLAAANRVRIDWEDTLRDHTRQHIFAYEVYATDLDPDSAIYTIIPVTEAQQRGALATSAEMYPIEHCLSVTIAVPGSRPSRKFWRFGGLETDYTDGVFSNVSLAALIVDDFNTVIGGGSYRDLDGELWTGVLKSKASHRRLGRLAGFELPTAPPSG
jgi:hypothetical protein